MQPVPPGLYEEAVSRLEEREESWVGQAVVARRDSDGVYCPGQPAHYQYLLHRHCKLKQLVCVALALALVCVILAVVSERLDGQCFELQWADGGHQEQSILHMFGPLTTRRALHAGDHVLGLAMPGKTTCTELENSVGPALSTHVLQGWACVCRAPSLAGRKRREPWKSSSQMERGIW